MRKPFYAKINVLADKEYLPINSSADSMSFMNYLQLRFLSICKAIEILSIKCDNISFPMKKGPYDLIVDAKGVISRIRILRTDHKSPCGSHVVSLRKGFGKGSFNSRECEFLFIDSPDGNYLIPTLEVNQKTGITLSMFNKYLITTE